MNSNAYEFTRIHTHTQEVHTYIYINSQTWIHMHVNAYIWIHGSAPTLHTSSPMNSYMMVILGAPGFQMYAHTESGSHQLLYRACRRRPAHLHHTSCQIDFVTNQVAINKFLESSPVCCCLETLVFFQYPKHGFWVLKLTTYLILLLVRAYQSWSDLRSRHLPWLGCQMVVSLPSFPLKFAGFSLRKVLSNQENSCHSSHRKTSCHSKSSNLSCADWVYDCKTMISIDGASSDSVL